MASFFQTIIDAIFNPVFGWMFKIPSLLAILILALVLAIISTLLQKYLTDQAKMRRLKDDTKKYQKQYKELIKQDPQKALKLQQKMLPLQMDLMKESFKPLLVTLIPFLLIFFWLNSHFAFHPIESNQPFFVDAEFAEGLAGSATLYSPALSIESPTQTITDGKTAWQAKGPAGEHKLVLEAGNLNYTRTVLITSERNYITPKMPMSGSVKSFNVGNEKVTPIPGLSIFGWHPGWIFYYILFSIPLSLLLKKWMNVV